MTKNLIYCRHEQVKYSVVVTVPLPVRKLKSTIYLYGEWSCMYGSASTCVVYLENSATDEPNGKKLQPPYSNLQHLIAHSISHSITGTLATVPGSCIFCIMRVGTSRKECNFALRSLHYRTYIMYELCNYRGALIRSHVQRVTNTSGQLQRLLVASSHV